MADTRRSFEDEIAAGARFEFGKNWARFLASLNDERIAAAEASLRTMLGRSLEGQTFLDVGSGSGLFSLAALRLGATRVQSFDFDPHSVECARALRRRYFPDDPRWSIERGSALDAAFLRGLGQWDVVYSWGVLHHTGAMWAALENVMELVAPQGALFVALYNDQGPVSAGWRRVKTLYNKGAFARGLVCAVFFPYFAATGVAADVLRRRPVLARYSGPTGVRGMSAVRDWHDWLGGIPFEVATPEAVIEVAIGAGFELRRLRTCGGRMGCNEFVFRRVSNCRAATQTGEGDSL